MQLSLPTHPPPPSTQIPYFRLDGSTKAVQRQRMMDAFNSQDCKVGLGRGAHMGLGRGCWLGSAWDCGLRPGSGSRRALHLQHSRPVRP